MVKRVVNLPWIFLSDDFAREMRIARENLKLSREAFAELLEIPEGTITAWENMGAGERMLMGNFLAICNALSLDPRQFWGVE